jgi:hypothetical protein
LIRRTNSLKQPQKASKRQLALALDQEVTVRLGENARQEMVRTLADLLLEALGGEASGQTAEVQNEPED